jgi:hypothetical protein
MNLLELIISIAIGVALIFFSWELWELWQLVR